MRVRIATQDYVCSEPKVSPTGGRYLVGVFYTLQPDRRWEVECIPAPGWRVFCLRKGEFVECSANCPNELISYKEMVKQISSNPSPDFRVGVQVQFFEGGPWEEIVESPARPNFPPDQNALLLWAADMAHEFLHTLARYRTQPEGKED